jgi:hypothetical protein
MAYQYPPQRRRPVWPWVLLSFVGAVFLAAIAIVVIALATTVPDKEHTVHGRFVLGAPCDQAGTGGYSDISTGTQVTAKNASGRVLAVAALTGQRAIRRNCVWTFAMTVPDADIYQFETGRRGALSYTRSDLAADDWIVVITVGDTNVTRAEVLGQ